MASTDKNRIVTPTTDPDRWTTEETALFNQGKCSDTVESGNGRGVVHCSRPSKPGASFGHCADHEARLAEYYWPDGSNRR